MAARSGQTTVAAAGTAVVLGTQAINGPIAVRALSTNSGLVYVGNDGAGDVTASNGFELNKEDVIVFNFIGDLNNLWVDSASNGDKVCWMALGSDPRF